MCAVGVTWKDKDVRQKRSKERCKPFENEYVRGVGSTALYETLGYAPGPRLAVLSGACIRSSGLVQSEQTAVRFKNQIKSSFKEPVKAAISIRVELSLPRS